MFPPQQGMFPPQHHMQQAPMMAPQPMMAPPMMAPQQMFQPAGAGGGAGHQLYALSHQPPVGPMDMTTMAPPTVSPQGHQKRKREDDDPAPQQPEAKKKTKVTTGHVPLYKMPKKQMQKMIHGLDSRLDYPKTAHLETDALSMVLWMLSRVNLSTLIQDYQVEYYEDLLEQFKTRSQRAKSKDETSYNAILEKLINNDCAVDTIQQLAIGNDFNPERMFANDKKRRKQEGKDRHATLRSMFKQKQEEASSAATPPVDSQHVPTIQLPNPVNNMMQAIRLIAQVGANPQQQLFQLGDAERPLQILNGSLGDDGPPTRMRQRPRAGEPTADSVIPAVAEPPRQPGETVPGETEPGETVPGETVPGETVAETTRPDVASGVASAFPPDSLPSPANANQTVPVTHPPRQLEELECRICLQPLRDGVAEVEALLCGHTFHTECITNYSLVTKRSREDACVFKCKLNSSTCHSQARENSLVTAANEAAQEIEVRAEILA